MFRETQSGKRVGIWIRVSTEDQAQGESPAHHEFRAQRYAKENSWTVVEVYDLAGVSGKSVWEHPECQRMLRDVKRGHIQGLIFSKLARLARNTKELLDFAQYFEKHKATLVSIEERIDTGTPAGILFYTMLGAIGQWEREEITSRLRSSIGVRAKLGKPLNGLAPYGYKWQEKRLVLVPAEAAVRREAFELFLAHRRKGVVARLLHEKGYRTRSGKKFADVHVDRMLRCSSAMGLYRTNVYRITNAGGWKKEAKPESEWGTAECPAIVSAEMFDRVAAILEEHTKPKRIPGKKPVHIFAGLLKCGCGGKMYVYTRSPNYTCMKCKNKIGAEVLEKVFTGSIADNLADTAQITAHLDRSKSKIAERNERAGAIRTQCESVRAEMKKLYDLYIAGGIGVEQFKELNTPLHDRLGQLSAELPKLEGETAALAVGDLSVEIIAHEARSLTTLWPTLDVDGKQRLAANICKEIIVPDKDPDAPIEIVFAHSAPPKHEAPVRIGAESEESSPLSPENFSEVSNRLNSQRQLRATPWVLRFKARSPVGAIQNPTTAFVPPLQGLMFCGASYPGRCPGLAWAALSLLNTGIRPDPCQLPRLKSS
jgi:site-specific DNA recombinase